jgi:hypothetical protein
MDKMEYKLNVVRAYSDDETKMQSMKEYRAKNKENIAVQRRHHYEENKNLLLGKRKEYCKKNREIVLDKEKERKNCCCGAIVSNCHMGRHRHSKKHMNYVSINKEKSIGFDN